MFGNPNSNNNLLMQLEKEDDIKDKLNELTDIIKMVYLPLMDSKPDTRIQMEKFVKQVGISLQQAYGNITIQVPELPPNLKDEEISNNKDLIEELINTLDKWSQTIKETLDRENSRVKDTKTAQGETEYWRQRAATFNTLYQQLNLPNVKRIVTVMESHANKSETGQGQYSFDNYKTNFTNFQKAYAQAKDFVKFLSTLDRQFKNINKGELQVIEETLPSLLTGLKLIWTISRHISQVDAKMEDILESISNEICDKVKAQINITKIFKKKPDEAIQIIKQGKNVLEQWKKEFDKTRRDIENQQTVKKWDFPKVKEIFATPIYMKNVLDDLGKACVIIQEFFAILGPDLKAVTGSAEQIDQETEKVRDQIRKLESFPMDIFSQKHQSQWRSQFDNFINQIQQIDQHVVGLIEKTFSEQLNSSEGAFDLLSKFQNVKTRDAIKELLNQKYDDVLKRYHIELSEMEELFIKGKDKPPISKNMPPNAGAIAWARSIMGRIKAPIQKFKNKSDQLMTKTFKTVAFKYVKLAKELDKGYEQVIFEKWKLENTQKAIELLKKNIFERTVENETIVYSVNFSPELKVIIREAKFLDRIGKTIPQTIINIALQEKDYMMHVDKLNKLLRQYNQAMSNLKPVEKKLMQTDIQKLNRHMDKGSKNHNWFSLSIDEFIKECQGAINSFNETKSVVLQHANNIEKKVVNIEEAQIVRAIDFDSREPMDISEFSDYFESYRVKVLAELVKDYANIGDQYLKSIEESTVKNNSETSKGQPNEEMRPYFMYWERRIFNAITKMVARALAANKTIWMRTEKPFLIKMASQYTHPEMTFHPTVDELRTQLEKFSRNILESTKSFGRWWDGFAVIFSYHTNEETGEKFIPFTFFEDVMQNKMVTQLNYEIIQCKEQIIGKFKLFSTGLKKISRLFDKNEMQRIQKQIEKSQSSRLIDIESYILSYKSMKEAQMNDNKKYSNYFILVDNSDVKDQIIKKIDDWLAVLGESLKNIASKELKNIMIDIENYQKALDLPMGPIEQLKALLNVISEIKNKSMDMEFRIVEVQEQFRVLKMYNFEIEEDLQNSVDNLMGVWQDLRDHADKKDFDVIEYKNNFAIFTQKEVEEFKTKIKQEYEAYMAKGPGTNNVNLDEGMDLLEASKRKVREFNGIREENVLAEKLFNLPISKYPELIQMEETNKKYSVIYDVYKDYMTQRKEFSVMSWSRLDATQLMAAAERFDKIIKKMAAKNPNFESMPPFLKLRETITGFKDSLPLIEMLKNPAIQERHWKRIMEETGQDLGEINLKSLSLEKVFKLELQNYQDKVTEICVEAKEEAKNEENLQKIHSAWQIANFEIVKYKKGNEDKGYAMKAPDEIRQLLEDNILILQSLSASKYVRAIKARVTQWERDLNIINDTIDTWMIVQRKWMYLESIFASDDIKMQLPDEAKKFGKTDGAYKKIMEGAHKQPNVLQACVKADQGNRLSDLKNISNDLDKCQKSLTNYLESKQMSFPRFYFISNDDLLQILGSSDPKAIQPFLLSLFDNCKRLVFGKGDKVLVGMVSDEGEEYSFESPVKPEGKVEDWMTKVDEEMKSTLRLITKKAVYEYAKEQRIKWIQDQIGMVALVGTQIWWTFSVEDVFNRVAKGDKHAMKNEQAKESSDLNDLISLVREDISSNVRKCVNTLIILDVHARDIVDRFVRDSILNAKEFDWESQLRFYWDQKKDDIVIRQCTGIFNYCYEYQGLNGRLVITPLTDRCIMTLTTALTFKLGGAPAGPAGTGKTETVKDLAKGLALRCVVTNCGETLDYVAMGIIFSGLIQTGFWGCFDEFNRINLEVLSVVSAQIKTIQNGLTFEKKKIDFLGTDMRLIPSIGIYITMNPGYAGRSELPDNLKALFRPVTMVVPDLLMICENMLMSEGFTSAKVLAKKMTVLYKLAREQLSKQYHYDFGLRALKSVLVMAGQLKRQYADLPEEIVLMRALRDMNMPKFVFEDVPLFTGLINDLFPGTKADRVGYESLNGHIIDYLEKKSFRHSDEEIFFKQVDKVVQLFETMGTRHTTMIVGPTGAGKSVILNTLAAALKEETTHPTQIFTINPKMITLNELYGVLDPESRDWTDGLLSKIFKDINQDLTPGKEERRWIVYDGDVDAVWVENMNSVMDDNRILTLANGDRIRLLKHCAMIFEVFDLQYASPATISRCGMVFVDAKNLGYAPYYERWVSFKKAKYGEIMADTLKELFSKYVMQCIERIFEGNAGQEDPVEPMKFITPRTNLNLVIQLCDIFDSMLPENEPVQELEQLEKFFLFCLTWSLGGSLVESDRDKFSEFLRNLSGLILPQTSLYDNFFNVENLVFENWDRKVPNYIPPTNRKFASILVPTVDTVRYSWLLNQIMQLKKPALFCGDSGTAKTVTVESCFRNLDIDKYQILKINMSSRTTSMDFQKIIEENIDKKTFKQYGPKAAGKKMVVFIDDMNMPKIDVYGTQQPLALALFLIGRLQLYQRGGDLELRDIVDTQFVGCITPAGAGNNRVDPRVISLFSVFNITAPLQDTTKKIYNQILSKHCEVFNEDIQSTVTKITDATMSLYFTIIERLPRTPVKFHYIFNLRDLSRVYEGLLMSTVDKFNSKEAFVRLWRHECMRVFSDRLVDQTDQDLVSVNLIPGLIKEFFKDTQDFVLQDPVILGDFALANPTDNEAEDPRLYEDLGDIATVKEKLYKMLEDYSFDHKAMSLVLFNDAIGHVAKIHRIIRFPKGCGLLVGYGGSGKQSLTKLATFTAGYELFTISLVRGYKEDNFKEDIRTLYKTVLVKPRTFLFTDSHVAEEGFLELINNILTIGMVPALFPEEEKDGLIQPLDDEMRKQKLPETKEFRWGYFVNKCRENLHIILAMSPAGDTLRIRCRNFPGLISNTSVDWFFPWPEDALTAVANNFMGGVELEEEVRQKVTDHLVMVHMSVQKFSVDFKVIYKRNNFSTPKNYLDFIKNYIEFLRSKRRQMDNMVRRLEGGLTTLAKAQKDTEALSKELAIQNQIIGEKQVVVTELIRDISQKTEVASVQQKAAAEKKAYLDEQSIIIDREEAKANKALEEAIPILEEAQAALRNISQKDLTEIKALAAPAKAIQDVCAIAHQLYPKTNADTSWANVKVQLLGDMKILDNLKNYQVQNTKSEAAARAKKLMQKLIQEMKCDGQELVDLIISKNKATGGLFQWCSATSKCYEIYKNVEPLRKEAEKMKQAKQQGEKELAETVANLEALNKSLGELNANKKVKQDELNELERRSKEMTRKLNAASQLINGLGSEQVRWTGDMKMIQEDKVKLIGDCLTGSAFLSYCGPFNSVLRQKMIFETWKHDLISKELPNKEDFRLDTFLTDEVEVSKWASQGLPTDELSVQNGILTTQASRWPLCIDPQMQAVTWIKQKEDKIESLNFNMGDYIKKLEMAIKFGKAILFEAIDEEIDPMIDPVLEKNIVKEAGVNMLTMGDQKMEYHDDFRMFLTTKISNPNYTPEIFGKTMIINFSVTMTGLRDQLLNEVVQFEKPEIEEQRKHLIIETSRNKATLKELEDTLLSELSKETDIPLVDNVPLIDTLNTAKTKSVEISHALEEAKKTNENIEVSRQQYKPVAWRGSILFFSIAGLSTISEMYEYSLTAFMTVFMNSLQQARGDNIIQNRIRNIKDKLTQLVYDFTCMGIFEKHKLMYSFQMVTMIMDGDEELNRIELDFFLKGNTSLDAVEIRKPYEWISDNAWKDIQKLETLNATWTGFIKSLQEYSRDWKEWYDLEFPEQAQIPAGYQKKLSKFQVLLLMRVIRPDRVVNSIKNFIIDKMTNDYYVKSPPISFEKIYQSSTNKTPIVFILSPGADPFSDVQKLVETVGLGMNKFKFLALGQGMGEQAKQYIEGGALRGHWVMLQNCHLLTSWLKTLERIFEGIQKPDKAFRLWLTTAPTDKFPLGILQKSLKVVTEPPDGLGQNIKQTYSKLSEEVFHGCAKAEFKPMLYVLSFFHAVIQERKKFGKIGWNVTYDFNASDYQISYQLISMYLNKAEETGDEDLPWDTLRYLIGEAMYGGRVTDDHDRRVLMTYLHEYLGNFIFDTNQKFFFSKTGTDYEIPTAENFELTLEFIDQIPLFTPPGVFGLHSNAEIQYFTQSAKDLWINILSMQTSDGGGEGGINREEIITQIANDIKEKTLPEVFDVYNIRKSFNVPSPTQVVLLQELERFNLLIQKMHSTIADLKRALKGEIGMSVDLDILGNSFFNGFLPPLWANLAPQTQKSLVNWIAHFERRFSQYRDWIDKEEPKVIWLSGLHIPESYLTALIQTTCRAKGWALDKSTMYTNVTKHYDPMDITQRLDQGTYVQGLYIEGARWNSKEDCLDVQEPKKLVDQMPLVQIIPVEANKLKLRGTIKTPVYITQARRNAMGVGLVFEADLKTKRHVSHWVLQGVAMMLNID